MKYKVGDRVKIKSNDFFNNNKGKLSFYVDSMALCFANEIVTIKSYGRYPNTYRIDEDEGDFLWTDDMIEGLTEEETKKENIAWMYDGNIVAKRFIDGAVIKQPKYNKLSINTELCDDKVELVISPELELKQEEDKWFVIKKKKEYPETYEECCNVLGYDDRETYCIFHTGANERLFEALYRLKVCRDAYWKIAGEEMGLGKPWKPDWEDEDETKWVIFNLQNKIKIATRDVVNAILAFPTEEMRDAFYENFKELIENCKELL